MKDFKIYVLNKETGEFEYQCRTEYHSALPRLMNTYAKPDDFVLIKDYTLSERKDEDIVHACDIVYLDGEQVAKYDHDITKEDLEKLKKNLPTIYRVDGTKTYLPFRPMSVNDVCAITGWCATMKIIKKKPHRIALLYFDTKQLHIEKMPQRNKKASAKFGFDLYGDVICIDENFVS